MEKSSSDGKSEATAASANKKPIEQKTNKSNNKSDKPKSPSTPSKEADAPKKPAAVASAGARSPMTSPTSEKQKGNAATDKSKPVEKSTSVVKSEQRKCDEKKIDKSPKATATAVVDSSSDAGATGATKNDTKVKEKGDTKATAN